MKIVQNFRPARSTRIQGFTIVELLIVVVVIAILAAITIVSYNGISNQARESAVKSSVRQGATALAAHYAVHGSYPENCEDAGVKVDTDYELNCSTSSGGASFCLSVSHGDISYRSDHDLLTPTVGACTPALPTYIPDTQITKLASTGGATNDNFGQSVAISGDTVAIGSPYDDNLGSNSGSAYIFTRSGGTWTQQAKLTASDGVAGDWFGYSVAVSGDTVLVGAYRDDGHGSAYIFTRSGSTWSQQAKLTASDSMAGDNFGQSATISGDTVLIGAPYDDNPDSNSGSAYIFTRSGGTWTQQAKLTASDGAAGDTFGGSVAISGETVVIGSYQDDELGLDSGSAYIFTRSGGTWTQQAKLTASDGAAYDNFGYSTDISGDTVIIGAYADDDLGSNSGSAYIFTRSGGTWTQQAKLTASDGVAGDNFGYSVAISGDTIVIGRLYGDNRGSAHIFTHSGSTWNQQAKLTASDGVVGDSFSYSLAISGDTVVIGAPHDDGHGSAYIFQDID